MLEDGRLDDARDFFFDKAKALVGRDTVRLPSIGGGDDGGGFRSERYQGISPHDRAALMACCNGMAKYYVAKNDYESVRIILRGVQASCFLGPHGRFIRPLPGSKRRRSYSST